MSEQPAFVFRFEMDLADRLRKALRVADVGVQEVAEVVGINRNMVSAWINGRSKPSDAQIAKIAMRTGAPKHWLLTGEINEESPSPSGDGLPIQSLHTESNRRPFHYNSYTSNVTELRPAKRELAASA